MKYVLTILTILTLFVGSAQKVTSYHFSECDVNSYLNLVQTRIVSKKMNADTLVLNIGFIANCCRSIGPVITGSDDTLFLSMVETSKIYCSCDCCFEMEINVAGVSDTNFVLMWGKYEMKQQRKYPKLPHEYVFSKNTPINKTNADGYKVGLWITKLKSRNGKYEEYYDLNPAEAETLLWTRVYNQKGELLRIDLMRGTHTYSFESDEYSRIFQ